MKKYKIVYQNGNDRYVFDTYGESKEDVILKFYLENQNSDIISIEEVTDD